MHAELWLVRAHLHYPISMLDLFIAMQDGDGWDVQRLKGELQALLLAMHDRMQSMETVQEQQNAAIQVHTQEACPSSLCLPRRGGLCTTLYAHQSLMPASTPWPCMRMKEHSSQGHSYAGPDEGPGGFDRAV